MNDDKMGANMLLQHYELFSTPRRCPKCRKMHLTHDYFCEHCLFFLLKDLTIGTIMDPLGNK